MKTTWTFFIAVMVLAGVVSRLTAAPLLISAYGQADLSGSPLDVTFASNGIAGGGTFSMQGSLQDYITGTGADTGDFSGYGGYSLSATINPTGILQAGGTVSISELVGPAYTSSQTLLTGILKSGASGTAWGYDNNNSVDQFSFLFTVTGGTEASDFGGIGAIGGVNLFADFAANAGAGHDTPYTGFGFGFPFNNLNNGAQGTGQGSADIFEVQPVPEPAVIALAGLAAVMVLGRRKAKKRLPIDN